MKRKDQKRGTGPFKRFNLLPLLYALPAAALMLYAAARWGRDLKKLIHVLIKLVVKA